MRDADLHAFVRDHLQVRVTHLEPLTAGIGLRRFVRLHLEGPPHQLVARIDAGEDPAGRPAGVAPEPALEPLRTVLEDAGLPVPRSFVHDPEARVDLLEDLGDHSLCAVWATDRSRAEDLLARAAELVPRIQRAPLPADLPARERRMDAALFRYKGELFARHSLPLALGRPARASEEAVVHTAFARIADVAERAPRRLAHRDFQSQNLLVSPSRSGDGDGDRDRLTMIDLQGALMAPPEYDLVCLLRDSYLGIDSETADALLEATRPELPDAPSRDECMERFDLLTLSRKGKDHARFLYVASQRGEHRWLRHAPDTARILAGAARRAAARDPRFSDLAELILALPTETPAEPEADTPCVR